MGVNMNGTSVTNITELCNASNPCSTSDPGSTQPSSSSADDTLNALIYTNYFMLPTMLVFGIGGNVLTIVIMQSPKFKKLTSRIFLIFLALSDITLLLTQPFNKDFIINWFKTDVRALSDVGCKIFFWFFRTGKMTSSWFVVCMCLERFIAVWFPLKSKRISTQEAAWIQIASVYLIIGGFNAVWTRNSKVVGGFCYPDHFPKTDLSEKSLYRAMLTAGSSLYSLIPLCILVTVTPLILFKLARHRQERKRLTSAQGSNPQTTKTTAMLVGIVVAYFILVLPITLLHNIAFYLGMAAFGENPKSFLIYKEVAQLLEQVNYGINFYLYILTSTQFREQLMTMLRHNKLAEFIRHSNKGSSSSSKPTKPTTDGKKGSPVEDACKGSTEQKDSEAAHKEVQEENIEK